MERRMMDAIEAALTARGWQLLSEGADVGIAVHLAIKMSIVLRHSIEKSEMAGDGLRDGMK
jgi:hypothetical protein